MGGLFATKMGVPIKRFIVAVNENDEFTRFYNTQEYEKISPSLNCLSNAMNVGHPSNFARLVSLYKGDIDEQGNIKKLPDMEAIRKDMWAISVTDQETKQEIKSIYDRFKTIIEPHGAVGLFAYEKYLKETNDIFTGVCLETAHPAKFPETINEVLGIDPVLPESMKEAMSGIEKMEKMQNNYSEFKKYLIDNFSK